LIRSMTAFSRRESSTELGEFTWELRSVNHRYLDASIRLPDALRGVEAKVKSRLSNYAARGKVELGLRYRAAEADERIEADPDKVGQLFTACAEIAATPGAPPFAAITTLDILRWPGVTLKHEGPDKNQLAEQALALLEEALQELRETREREGAKLKTLLSDRLDQIEQITNEVDQAMPVILANLKK